MVRRLLLGALVAALAVTLALPAGALPGRFPPRVEEGFPTTEPPEVTAATWILYDETADAVLAAQLPNEERAMASITKIMTGLLAIEEGDLSDPVTITANAAATGEREIDLVAGETLSLDALVKAALIHSANDAATAIAEHIGGSVSDFVEMMNERAAELGMDSTSFANPHGLDAPGHYSTAADMLTLAKVAMSHESFRDIVRSQIVVFPDAPDGSRRIGTATNLMLADYPGTIGIKTGFTSRALLTFVASAERDSRRLYAVVLGSDGRRAHFADATALFDYGFVGLQVIGTIVNGTRYVSIQDRVTPSPLVRTTNVETFVHLAGQGLMTDPPASLVALPEPEPPPITSVTRRPQESPESLWGSLSYWWSDLFDG